MVGGIVKIVTGLTAHDARLFSRRFRAREISIDGQLEGWTVVIHDDHGNVLLKPDKPRINRQVDIDVVWRVRARTHVLSPVTGHDALEGMLDRTHARLQGGRIQYSNRKPTTMGALIQTVIYRADCDVLLRRPRTGGKDKLFIIPREDLLFWNADCASRAAAAAIAAIVQAMRGRPSRSLGCGSLKV